LGGFQRLFRLALPARLEDARAMRECDERLETKIYPRLLSCRRQRLYRRVGAGNAGVPAIHFPADGNGLGDAFQGTMQPDADAPDPGEAEKTTVQHGAIAILRDGKTGVAPLPLKARIAWCLAILDAAELCLKRAIKAQDDILQDMGMDFSNLLA
jgi:hypothetical protein